MKRCDYVPANLVVISFNHWLIQSFSHHLMIYKNFQLIWAAKTEWVNHGIGIGTF